MRAATWIVLTACLVGCEDAAKKPVTAHVSALPPQAAATQKAPPVEVGRLPLRDLKAQPVVPLVPRIPSICVAWSRTLNVVTEVE